MGLLSQRSEDDDQHGEVRISGLDDLDLGAPEELVYDLDDWSERGRTMLRERLETLAVPHRWEDDSLVVAAPDEAWVERVMDQVEDDLAGQLDDEVEQVAYDLTGWDEENMARLVDRLLDEAIPHGFDGCELLVHEIDEQRVDELVEELLQPDNDRSTGASASADVMGAIFVAADRLARDARDHDGAHGLVDALQQAATAPAPYGMDRLWWDGVQAQAQELLTLMEGELPDDESVIARAGTLRDDLRPFV